MNVSFIASERVNLSLVDAVARHIAAALVFSLWEGFVLATIVAVGLKLVPNTTAKLRFAIWAVAFVALAASPLWNAFQADRLVASAPLKGIASSATPHLQLDPHWSYALAAVWVVAAIVRFAYLAAQAIQLRSLWNSAIPVAAALLPELPLGRVELCVSTEIDRPGVIGFFAPRILLPTWLLDQLTPGELEQIVLHELEHLRRRDDWINLLQKIGLVLLPLSPALFWIDRRLAAERELACDDGVLTRTHAPRAYATCLTTLAERRLEHSRCSRLTVLALGAVGALGRSDFSRRIQTILISGQRSPLSPAAARAMTVIFIAVLLGGSASLAHAPQLVSFSAASPMQPAAASLPASQIVRSNQLPQARFENVVFHPPQPTAAGPTVANHARRKSRSKPQVAVIATQSDTVYSAPIPNPNRKWMVLSSWQPSAPQPVFVTLSDGRTFLATYAADSNQPGWLLIQL